MAVIPNPYLGICPILGARTRLLLLLLLPAPAAASLLIPTTLPVAPEASSKEEDAGRERVSGLNSQVFLRAQTDA